MPPVWVIVLVVLAIAVVGALFAFSPMLNKKGDAATARVKEVLGSYDLFENKAVAMGTEPEEAGGVRGLAVLAVNSESLLAVTWAGTKEWRVSRAAITSIETEAVDPAAVQKALVEIHYDGEDGPAIARFRVPQPVEWLDVLGYDWGPDGKPETTADA